MVLLGRPAAGKSEILEHLRVTEVKERTRNYHIGGLDVIDDFPMLWTWFEEDDILDKKFNLPRLHTDDGGYFKYPYLWNLLIERIGLDYRKLIRDNSQYHQHSTTIIEFSRGSEHGGYQQAFEHLSDQILERAGVIYVQVSYAESRRKNRLRFNPQRPDSILEHGLEDEKLERLYRDDDWHEMLATSSSRDILTVRGVRVPYTIFENEDDVTTPGGEQLSQRLEETLGKLWKIQGRIKASG
ncbi:MAG: hypothetical protein ACW97O_06870 [Candidatus Thorarchaeota archaeon]